MDAASATTAPTIAAAPRAAEVDSAMRFFVPQMSDGSVDVQIDVGNRMLQLLLQAVTVVVRPRCYSGWC